MIQEQRACSSSSLVAALPPRDLFVRRFARVSRQPRPDDDQRRVVCSSSSERRSSLHATTNLRTIPGIGPKNEKLMVASGLDSIETLREAFSERKNERQAMMDFLKETVGVRNSAHTRMIATYLQDEAAANQICPQPKPRLTFCVEGNISVGKTTFLRRIAAESEALQGVVDVVPEPIEKWQNVVGRTKDGKTTSFNLLDEFYRAPERYAYTFQNYVFYTRFLQEQESRHVDAPLRLMERSVFSDRHVFVSSIRESNWMNDIEMTVYESWFDHVVDTNKQLIPNGFIYMRAEPKTCHNRLNGRAREEETKVSMEYLSSLHEKHESWFKPSLQPGELLTPKGVVLPANAASNGSLLSLNADLTMIERSYMEPPEIIRDRVVWMDNTVHRAINKVPALILDCDPSIDMDKDSAAKAMYAAQVRAFYDYVREMQDSVDKLSTPAFGAPLTQARSLSQDEQMILMYIKDQGGDPSVMGFPVSRADQPTDVKQQRYQLYSNIADATRVRGKGNRQQFPDGVVAAVRNLYPDPDEQYTGFRDARINARNG